MSISFRLKQIYHFPFIKDVRYRKIKNIRECLLHGLTRSGRISAQIAAIDLPFPTKLEKLNKCQLICRIRNLESIQCCSWWLVQSKQCVCLLTILFHENIASEYSSVVRNTLTAMRSLCRLANQTPSTRQACMRLNSRRRYVMNAIEAITRNGRFKHSIRGKVFQAFKNAYHLILTFIFIYKRILAAKDLYSNFFTTIHQAGLKIRRVLNENAPCNVNRIFILFTFISSMTKSTQNTIETFIQTTANCSDSLMCWISKCSRKLI